MATDKERLDRAKEKLEVNLNRHKEQYLKGDMNLNEWEETKKEDNHYYAIEIAEIKGDKKPMHWFYK